MLLTLATTSVSRRWSSNGEVKSALLDLPALAIRSLDLRGLNVDASLLAGWTLEDLDLLRDRADKAACPCLVLVDQTPLYFASEKPKPRNEAAERLRRLATAANRLGCNSLSICCEAPDTDEAFEAAATNIRSAMSVVERVELNLLLAPSGGLTADPDRLTELIKRIGGFRIGSLPSFGHAASFGDPAPVLRKLAPYAGAIHATVNGFSKSGKHKGYDLEACIEAIRSVGFTNTLAIEYLGDDDPLPVIEQARDVLQAAIDADQN